MAIQKRDLGPAASYEEQINLYGRVHRFAMSYIKYSRSPREHLARVGISMTEAHFLMLVVSTPGLTVAQAARASHCTSGRVSQNVSKLEQKGLLERRKLEGNAKQVHLYPTAEGKRVAGEHMVHGQKQAGDLEEVLADCTDEEVAAFFKVMEAMGRFFDKNG